eukprot:566124-Amphidinium_carterae.2
MKTDRTGSPTKKQPKMISSGQSQAIPVLPQGMSFAHEDQGQWTMLQRNGVGRWVQTCCLVSALDFVLSLRSTKSKHEREPY